MAKIKIHSNTAHYASPSSAGWTAVVVAIVAALAFAGSAQAQLSGAGSSLAKDLVGTWSTQYGAASGGVTYEATGSSSGVARASDSSVDFGVTDVAMTSVALRQAGLRQVPLAATAVAVIVNLPQLGGKPVKLNGDILADIYQGSITQWNHSQIAGANPGMALPNIPIVPVWRTDGSGQSHVLSSYLARSNTKWRRNISATSTLALTAGKGVRGGQAMLDTVKTTPGAVGYEPLGSALKAGLSMAELQNAAGKSVAANATTIKEALERAQWSADNGAADLDGSVGAGAYPLTAVTYALLPIAIKPGRKNALPFIQTAVAQGDAQASQSGFVPLSPAGKTIVAAVR
jgi:phosphate transport system substrate-binding protein